MADPAQPSVYMQAARMMAEAHARGELPTRREQEFILRQLSRWPGKTVSVKAARRVAEYLAEQLDQANDPNDLRAEVGALLSLLRDRGADG